MWKSIFSGCSVVKCIIFSGRKLEKIYFQQAKRMGKPRLFSASEIFVKIYYQDKENNRFSTGEM